MPELKCVKTQIVKVEYGDLEDFIEEVYGHKHEIVAAEEGRNDSNLVFNGVGMYPEDRSESDKKDFKEWLESGKHWAWGTGDILEELCLAGHIEPGDYLVSIWW